MVGLTSLAYGLVFGPWTEWLMYGLGSVLVLGFMVDMQDGPNRPAQGLRWSPDPGYFVLGLAASIGCGIWAAFEDSFVEVPILGLVTGFKRRPTAPTESVDPGTLLAKDRGAFHGTVLVVMLTLGLAFLLLGALTLRFGDLPGSELTPASLFRHGDVQVAGVVVIGLMIGLPIATRQTEWGPFTVARCWLALRGRLPWRLMRFLADAHQHRGVLRAAGAVYQFRHVELQRHLADRT